MEPIVQERSSVPRQHLADLNTTLSCFVPIAVTCPRPIPHALDISTPQVWFRVSALHFIMIKATGGDLDCNGTQRSLFDRRKLHYVW